MARLLSFRHFVKTRLWLEDLLWLADIEVSCALEKWYDHAILVVIDHLVPGIPGDTRVLADQRWIKNQAVKQDDQGNEGQG